MYALLFDNKVVDVAENQFEVHESMSWVDCPDDVKIGWIIENEEFVDPLYRSPQEVEVFKSKKLRSQRDALLSQSDWTQVPDAPVNQTAWAEYRQALRDLPQQAGFPTKITWPQKP